MNSLSIVVIVAVACFMSVNAASVIPPWLTPCKGTDPKLPICAEKEANKVIPIIAKGYPKLNLPVLEPLSIPEIKVESNGQLNIILRDGLVHGLSQSKASDFKADFKNQKIGFKLFIPNLSILSKYEVDGRILVLPIQGKGPGNITAVDGLYDINFSYELYDKQGVQYAKMKDVDVSFELKRLYIRFDNLFNGNKELGDAANNAVNAEWRVVLKELEPVIKGAIGEVVLLVANGVANKVPFEEIFAGDIPK